MKKSKYCNIFSQKPYLLLHNSLENTVMRIYNPEYKNWFLNWTSSTAPEFEIRTESDKEFYEALKKTKMILPDDYNETNVANQRFFEHITNDTTLGIIIIPTRQCNFRCPYCYEEHVNDIMEWDTYLKLRDFIVAHIQKDKRINRVSLSWFGGEPLLEYDNICEFMELLRLELPAEISIYGSMTTNGYLLTPERFKILNDLGVVHYQITLDGLEDSHNKTRFLVGGQGSWKTIITNLQKAKKTDLKFNILIRTNFTKALLDDAEDWFQFILENFDEDSRFTYHFEVVRDLGGDDKTLVYHNSSGSARVDYSAQITEKCTRIGLNPQKLSNFIAPFSMMCYAAIPSAFVIDFDGTIRKCSVVIDEDYNNIGNLLNDSTDLIDEEKQSWWQNYSLKEDCLSCSIYPLCYGRKCPNSYYNPEFCKELYSIYEARLLANY